jgi:hypothetical protein
MILGDPFHRVLPPSERTRLGHLLVVLLLALVVYLLLTSTANGI